MPPSIKAPRYIKWVLEYESGAVPQTHQAGGHPGEGDRVSRCSTHQTLTRCTRAPQDAPAAVQGLENLEQHENCMNPRDPGSNIRTRR